MPLIRSVVPVLRGLAGLLSLSLLVTGAALGQEEEETDPWSNVTELALVQTTGNSESFTFSFKNKYVRNWARSSFTIDALALRTDSTNRVLANVDGEIVESSEEEVTGEQYRLSLQYDHVISERAGWFSLGGWQRNRPAGINNRYNLDGGLSYVFFDSEVHSLIGQGGFGWTYEEPLDSDGEGFPTARAFSRYERRLSATADFDTQIELIENLDDTDDLRINFLIGVTANITDRLALRVSYSAAFDNSPVTEIVPGDDPEQPDAIFVFDKTDTILAASLVIDF